MHTNQHTAQILQIFILFVYTCMCDIAFHYITFYFISFFCRFYKFFFILRSLYIVQCIHNDVYTHRGTWVKKKSYINFVLGYIIIFIKWNSLQFKCVFLSCFLLHLHHQKAIYKYTFKIWHVEGKKKRKLRCRIFVRNCS